LSDNFIDIPFTSRNLDRFIVRSSILKAINANLGEFSGRMLDAGCGRMPYRQYILDKSGVTEYVGLDIESAKIYDKDVRPDFTWDGKTMPFPDNSFDCAFATEVLEHCPEPEVFLREVNRVLKKGGKFFFTVPFLWNLHEVPHDEYRYTPFALTRHLNNSRFEVKSLQAMGGWHASLGQMLGLWVRRAPMHRVIRRILSVLFKPAIRFLLRMDKNDRKEFKERSMISGLYGVALKSVDPLQS
jgi:SAM-dependent methyltransferase